MENNEELPGLVVTDCVIKSISINKCIVCNKYAFEWVLCIFAKHIDIVNILSKRSSTGTCKCLLAIEFERTSVRNRVWNSAVDANT